MKKIILPILLLFMVYFPAITHAEECTQATINQYKTEIESIKMDVEHDKDILMEQGDYTQFKEKRSKGIYAIKFDNIPNDYLIKVYSNDYTRRYDSNTSKITGYVGGIYTIEYINNKCSSIILKKTSIYLPTYSGNPNGKIWDDNTVYTEEEKESNPKTSIALILILVSIILATLVLVALILKKRKESIGDLS